MAYQRNTARSQSDFSLGLSKVVLYGSVNQTSWMNMAIILLILGSIIAVFAAVFSLIFLDVDWSRALLVYAVVGLGTPFFLIALTLLGNGIRNIWQARRRSQGACSDTRTVFRSSPE